MLIQRARKGDLDAFDQLVARHDAIAFKCAYLIVRNEDDAAEAVQEAFVRAFRQLRSLRSVPAFRSWLLRIIRNESLRVIETQQRRREVRLDASTNLAEGQVTAADSIAYKENQMDLWAALGLLSSQDRAVVTLRYYLGFNEKEMATVLQCRRGTVKSRLHNALMRLGVIIQQGFPELIPGSAKAVRK